MTAPGSGEQITAELAEELDALGLSPGSYYAPHLLPVVEAYATRKAAEALTAAAGQLQAAADVRVNATVAGRVDEHRRGVGDGLEWAADDLTARADALTATHPDHGKA